MPPSKRLLTFLRDKYVIRAARRRRSRAIGAATRRDLHGGEDPPTIKLVIALARRQLGAASKHRASYRRINLSHNCVVPSAGRYRRIPDVAIDACVSQACCFFAE